MKITVEELIRLEEQDIRELRREDLDNAGDIVIDRSVPAERRMMEFLEKTKKSICGECGGLHPQSYILKGFRRNAGR